MSGILDKALIWAERQLPDGKSLWITDLRYEANHIPGSLARQRFLWSGILAALGQVLRVRVGVQQVGQTLLGLAILAFCLGGLIVAPNIETAVVKQTFYTILPVYALTGGLAFLSLNWMKGFTGGCILALGLFWLVSGLEFFATTDAPIWFFRAFAIEASVIMAGLFIAASYLSWIEDAKHG